MFSRLRKVMADQVQARALLVQRQERVQLALVRQAQAAMAVRQLVLVDSLARLWLPVRMQQAVQVALQDQLVAMTRTLGSLKSTGSSAKTARRSTSRRRRRR